MVLDYPKALELVELFADYGFEPLGPRSRISPLAERQVISLF